MTQITLIPVQDRGLSFTPIGNTTEPFAQLKRDFPDFQAVKNAYLTFALLKTDTVPSLTI